MPVLNGSNPYSWIARAEKIFCIINHVMEARMELVSFSLEVDALSWYNYKFEYRCFV